jgi:hypothetical protein
MMGGRGETATVGALWVGMAGDVSVVRAVVDLAAYAYVATWGALVWCRR